MHRHLLSLSDAGPKSGSEFGCHEMGRGMGPRGSRTDDRVKPFGLLAYQRAEPRPLPVPLQVCSSRPNPRRHGDVLFRLCDRRRHGERIQSPTFWVGGYSWRIFYYPNGARPSCADYISVFLHLRRPIAKPIKVRARFSLLDRSGNPVPGHSSLYEEFEYLLLRDGYGVHEFIRWDLLEASEHLVDGCFRIRCDISVPAKIRTEYRAPPLSDLQQHLGNLLVAKEGNDVTFQVSGETFSANRCVLAARSPVFRAELFGSTKEGTATTKEDCIQINDMLAHVFETLLHFIYTDSLPEMTGLEEPMRAEHFLKAADRYGVQRLKLICEEKLSRDVNENTVAKMLRLPAQHRCHTLRETCIEFLKDPPSLDVLMTTDDGLFELVAMWCPVVLKELWAYEDDPFHDELIMCL
ncbi:hypothetical protein HU200_049527 [Digitaria exilis]|uniref:Uncharacterized protein n=1 Tax=Digitaria exilis TaxID=1010633 RepID=A0A835AYM7_9POAL|nr:hypothetical protein HU200_049527 [Digitaria exilis]